MAKAEMGICLRSCVECRVQNIGAALVDMLSWNPNRVSFMLTYDRERDDKISQLVIIPIVVPSLEVVTSLEETARGNGGFGSTGR